MLSRKVYMLLPQGKQSRFGANAYPYYLLESEQKQMNLFQREKSILVICDKIKYCSLLVFA